MLESITWTVFDDNLCGEFGFFHHVDFMEEAGYKYLLERLDEDTIAVFFFFYFLLDIYF